MLTLTPPETREDEIQVDETDDRNLMLRLSPTRVNARRKERNARGFNYIQLIVGMIIFVALSRIVGPPAFRMITRARSTALSANIQTAAETVRNVLAIDPASRGDMTANATTGAPMDSLLAALTDDAPFNWEASWALTDSDDSDTIRVQLVEKDSVGAPGVATPAKVDWLLNDWDAVRVHARNQDGAWACALIVLKPNADDLDADNDASVGINGADDGGTAANNMTVANANARLRGVWYDSGDTYAAGAAGDALHCSPVATAGGTAIAASCTGATGGDATACHTADGAWLSAVAANNDIDPLPGGANLWGIVSGRVLTRNL